MWLFLVLGPPKQTAPAERPEASSRAGLTLLTVLLLLKNETYSEKQSLHNYARAAESRARGFLPDTLMAH